MAQFAGGKPGYLWGQTNAPTNMVDLNLACCYQPLPTSDTKAMARGLGAALGRVAFHFCLQDWDIYVVK